MLPNIDNVIYFYMFICAALLVFNVLYIFRSKGRSRARVRAADQWRGILERELEELSVSGVLSSGHRRLLERRLERIESLMAYNQALEPHLDEVEVRHYLDACHDVYQTLAVTYRRRPAMERAFFAHLIALYHPDRGRVHDQLSELLLDFLEDSTVYCRENVLQALYAMGSAGGVARALQLFHERGWYHHPRLLADGLCGFYGDREALAQRLWSLCGAWDESLQVAIIQFAANLSDSFTASFLEALEQPSTPLETRFALIRYFQRWPDQRARPLLLTLASPQDSETADTAIAACAALARYPGADTAQVLKQALHSRNWHVRRNAASSLAALGVSGEDLEEIRRSGDRYACEMLEYMARLEARLEAPV